MKRLVLTISLLILCFITLAQEKEIGRLQVGAFGGASFPLSTYKTSGEAKTGYFGAVFMDKYISSSSFGLGIDARFLNHSLQKHDSIIFENGYIAHNYQGTKFKNLVISLGPTYSFQSGKLELEAFLRAGVLWQQFPAFETSLNLLQSNNQYTQIPIKRTSNDSTNRAKAWLGLAGLRLNYPIKSNFSLFLQADYMQSIGTTFGKKTAVYQLEERIPTGLPIDEQTFVKSFLDHYQEVLTSKQAAYKSVNVALGVKYFFGKKQKSTRPTASAAPEIIPAPITEKLTSKNIQIVVKDKLTGLALSGVTITVHSDEFNTKETSNANGEISRITQAKAGTYKIVGEKNGIKTELVSISPADFVGPESLIFKEIFHDDPRFTLIGETVDCEKNQLLSNIATILTHAGVQSNMTQTSDLAGKFIYQLAQQSDYTIVANQAGRYSQTELISTKGLDRSKTLYVTLKLGVCDLVEGANWVLKNIHYDFDQSNIRPDAALILDNVVNIMNQNPSLRIELSSHTDSRGKDEYNLRLSQQRAESAVQYLLSKGIIKSRLVAKGYGETRLLNHCENNIDCSEANHQVNRRTEIKVLNLD